MPTSRRSLFHASFLAMLAAGLLAQPVTAQFGIPQPLTLTLDDLLVLEPSSGRLGATMHGSLLSPAPVAFVLAPTVGPIALSGETRPTGSVNCTLGVDFLTHIDPVSIAVGQTTFTFDVVICGNTQSETTERLRVRTPTLTSPVMMSERAAILEIRDFAATGTPTNPVIVGGDAFDLRVQLSRPGGSAGQQNARSLTVYVEVENDGPLALSSHVQIALPAGVAFDGVGLVEGVLPSCSRGSGMVDCSLSSLGAGASRKFALKAQVTNMFFPDSTPVTFTATVDPANAIIESDEANNTDTVPVTVRAASDLRITAEELPYSVPDRRFSSDPANEGAVCRRGRVVHLQLSVTNNGPYRSPPTRVATTWPSGVTSVGGSKCFDTCDVPALDPGGLYRLEMIGLFEVNRSSGAQAAASDVDPDGTVLEGTEGNNRITFACT